MRDPGTKYEASAQRETRTREMETGALRQWNGDRTDERARRQGRARGVPGGQLSADINLPPAGA